uniref:Uncharacterized protein n=1 Tax=Avena sativa TaxID=4498 RepID=A0ACD5WRL5_AVESA
MADCIPPSTENQALGPALGPRQSLYSSFSLALALRGGAIMRAPTKLRVMVRWLSMDRRHSPDGADQIRENPPRLVPGLLDPEKVAAAVAALRVAIVDGARSIPSLAQRRADDKSGHRNHQHISYPLIQSLEAGDSPLFFVPGSAGTVPGLPDGVYRLSDVQENPWILKAGTETFPGPCELTNERTQTWIMRLKITTKLVGLSKQQLHEQNWEQCFSEVAGQPLEQLLVVARSVSAERWSDVHISQMLTVFDALVDVLFNIQGLRFSGCGEVASVVNKMEDAFKGVIERTSNEIRISKESTIHPATFVLIQALEFFYRNSEMVQSILESGDYNTGPCSDMVNCLIPKLKECADKNFQETGRRYIFILNNIYYVKNCPPGLLPPTIMSNLVSLADQNIVSYLHEYWFPPMLSYLDGDSLMKPRRSSMDKFMKIFFSICDSQMTWKVQTTLKEKLREEIVKLIVPKYVKFLEALQESRSSHSSWIKGMRRARSEKPVYTAVHLEQVIRGLFER